MLGRRGFLGSCIGFRNHIPPEGVRVCRLLHRGAKFLCARIARAYFPQVLEAVDSGGVRVGKFQLNGIISNCRSFFRRDSWFVHRQYCSAARFRATFFVVLALIVANRAGAMIAQIRKIVSARVPVRPDDFDALACRHVDLHAGRSFSHVQLNRHFLIILADHHALIVAAILSPNMFASPPATALSNQLILDFGIDIVPAAIAGRRVDMQRSRSHGQKIHET